MTLDPVRFSRLKLMGRSPLHYAAATVEETMAMELGSAVHSLVLGGAPVVAWRKVSENGNPCPRRGKDYDAFEADHPGAEILTATEYDKAQAIADAVRGNPLAMSRLDGEHEVEKSWRFGNRECAGRMDSLGTFLTELKVTMSADPAKVLWQALRMGWSEQLVWYLDGLAAAGIMVKDQRPRLVAVESKPPFAVTTFVLDDETIDRARRTYRLWFEKLRVCEDTDEWPAYSQGEVELHVPDNDVALDFGDVEAA